jgi:hypothetical protein
MYAFITITNPLKDYFIDLSAKELYSAQRQYDRIALIAIYMPIIREEVHAYQELWDKHTIRKQKDRPNVVPGKPVFNYHYSHTRGVPNCGWPVDPELIEEIRADTAHFSKYYLYARIIDFTSTCIQTLTNQ